MNYNKKHKLNILTYINLINHFYLFKIGFISQLKQITLKRYLVLHILFNKTCKYNFIITKLLYKEICENSFFLLRKITLIKKEFKK